MTEQHDEALKANEELRRHVDETMNTMHGSLSDVQSTIAQLTLQFAKLAMEKEKVQLEEDPSVNRGEQKTPDPVTASADPGGKVAGSVMGSAFGIPAQLCTQMMRSWPTSHRKGDDHLTQACRGVYHQMHRFNLKGIEQRTPDLGVIGVGSVLGLGTANQTQFTPTLNQFTPSGNLIFPSSFQSHITQHPYHTNSPYIAAFRAPGNSADQMNASAPTVPVFGRPLVSPSPTGFMFGSTAPSPSPSPSPSPFLFGGQLNPTTPQKPSPFQASNSLDFSAGGSFSLSSGGGDKSARKMSRVSRSRNRKR